MASTAMRDLASGGSSQISTNGSISRSTPSAAQEKHFSRTQINEVTKLEQNHGQLKNFSMLAMVGLAYAILNSWVAMCASLSLSLPSGGPVATLWGLVVSFLGNFAMAASMGELAHVFTTSGGPYHWSAILAPASSANYISWVTGWFAVAGWTALTATTGSLAGELLLGAYSLSHPGFEPQPYQTFVIYAGYICLATAINLWGSRLLPHVNSAAIIWSLSGAIVVIVVTLAKKKENFQSADFVFRTFLNESGWNNGVAWILGLLQSSFGLIGLDALSHMAEEIPQPHLNIPKAMIWAVCIGASSSFVVLMVLLFVMKDYEQVIVSPSGALLEIFFQATGSTAGAICLQIFPIIAMEFAAQGILCAASRMTHAFARDHGLPFSKFFAKSNPKTGVPDRAVLLTSTLVIIFGLIYLGSSSALSAILSSSVVFLNCSYCIPIALLLCRGRHLLEPESFPPRTWSLGPILGPVANISALCFTALTTVFFLFPPGLPVTGSNMNYAIAVFGFVFLVSVTTWLVQGRRTFTGPRDLGALLELARAEVDRGEVRPTRSRRGSHDQSSNGAVRRNRPTRADSKDLANV
ncbi:uncharacterized protein JCM6883_006148 [Sporobolomyces salmoneus]|uniref:uncharacterized protein n=1 Tax=Sporobolomyces salmoneus TaxID=183962 RepID=UPI0031743CB6